ncbi:MAG: SAM-dependent methyltransferase, partial [Bacteroidia bacterium]
KVMRMSYTGIAGRRSILEFHYMIGEEGKGIRHEEESHLVTMFEESDFAAAFEALGLTWQYDPNGLTGRGLYSAWWD